MKKLVFILFIVSLCFSQDEVNLFNQALKYEKEGNINKAMEIYKELAQENLSLKNQKDNFVENKKKTQYKKYRENIYRNDIKKIKDKQTRKTVRQIITANFDLHPYKKNYLLPVSYDLNDSKDRNQFETIFQLSFEKPISYNLFGLGEIISGAYTQKSFWQTFEDSSPFRETNYEPELFMQVPYAKSKHFKAYKIGFNHQSNGRNENYSRSWNRVYAEAYFQSSNILIVPKVWYRIPDKGKDDNPDISKYLGYGDLKLIYPYKKHLFEFILRDNLRFNSQNKGSVELNWTFPMPKFINSVDSFGMIHIFSGYGNNLIDYNRETHKIGFGIAFSR